MNGTPRLRSSYPSTPGSGQRNQQSRNNPQDTSKARSTLPNLPENASAATLSGSSPLIPVNLVDAPSQRFYILSVYGMLIVWCLYDWWKLVEEDTHSFGLFLKWTCIYAIFSYGVPQLRIPWLEWSTPTSNLTFIAHAAITFMLMFRIPVRWDVSSEMDGSADNLQLPIEGWLLFFTKTIFDREMSISENSVRPASILHNSSLIMGKQIINILPEG
jgi:nucleoporin POM152